jgi:hypothetical protein
MPLLLPVFANNVQRTSSVEVRCNSSERGSEADRHHSKESTSPKTWPRTRALLLPVLKPACCTLLGRLGGPTSTGNMARPNTGNVCLARARPFPPFPPQMSLPLIHEHATGIPSQTHSSRLSKICPAGQSPPPLHPAQSVPSQCRIPWTQPACSNISETASMNSP